MFQIISIHFTYLNRLCDVHVLAVFVLWSKTAYIPLFYRSRRAKNWPTALELLFAMGPLGLRRDDVNFNTVMSAASHGQQWERAIGLLQLRDADGMPLSLITCDSASSCMQVPRCTEAWKTARSHPRGEGMSWKKCERFISLSPKGDPPR